MARQPSLRSQLNQIRAWVRQGRTNAWIAHQLDVTVEQLERFKTEHNLDGSEQAGGRAVDPLSIPVPERASPEDEQDDEADEDRPTEKPAEEESRPSGRRSSIRRSRRGRGGGRGRERDATSKRDQDPSGDRESPRSPAADDARGEGDRPKRRRGRRGGKRRRKIPTYEATFDQGQEGYGFWLDPAIADNPVYREHWQGQRAIEVRFDSDSITIRKASPGRGESGD